MPLYEYQCIGCESTFEARRPIQEINLPIRCPICESSQTKRVMFHVLSVIGSASPDRAGAGCGSCSSSNCSACHGR